MYSLPIQVPLP
ncbi:aminotransferase class-III family protein, partial [Vibrio parahaemolyticus V-223/04]